jgi:hypothetical protein
LSLDLNIFLFYRVLYEKDKKIIRNYYIFKPLCGSIKNKQYKKRSAKMSEENNQTKTETTSPKKTSLRTYVAAIIVTAAAYFIGSNIGFNQGYNNGSEEGKVAGERSERGKISSFLDNQIHECARSLYAKSNEADTLKGLIEVYREAKKNGPNSLRKYAAYFRETGNFKLEWYSRSVLEQKLADAEDNLRCNRRLTIEDSTKFENLKFADKQIDKYRDTAGDN